MKKVKENKKTLKKPKRRVITPQKKNKTRNFWLNVLPNDLWIRVRQGETIKEALQNAGVELEGECAGLGKCGKCKVKVLTSVGPQSQEARDLLDEEELKEGIRLACRTIVNKDLVVQVFNAETEPDAEYHQILKTSHRPLMHPYPLIGKRLITVPDYYQNQDLSDFDVIKLVMVPEYQDLKASVECLRTLPKALRRTQYHGAVVMHNNNLLAWQDWEQVNQHYGLVFDLGTSTLVGKLINFVDGDEVAVVSSLNSQFRYGSNVISRLQYVKEHQDGLQLFHNLLVRDLNRLSIRLLKTAGLKPQDIFIAVAAGNTTMQHFLLGLDPSGIAEAPFTPVVTDGLVVRAENVGLQFHPEALLYVMPIRSAYIGGDLISVILASGALEHEDEIMLGMDLGTNGELFMGNRKRILACSAAAGPAFEGATISHGMIAKVGAIENVSFEDGNIDYDVIGNIKPKGICGSGLVDLVAILVRCEVIDSEGVICPPNKAIPENLRSRIISRAGVYDFMVADAEESYDNRPIYLTQRDVRELQLAKAAIAAGVKILTDEMDIEVKDIKRVYLAGALGNYVDPVSALRIGLIPNVDPEIITLLGNAASTGAYMVLLSKDYWQVANDLSDNIEYVELSSRLDFNEYFIEQMDFPNNNI
jgi:uncharacterized 2Fe-2S/4Fe-4S cluster protein (DUF4445 family)